MSEEERDEVYEATKASADQARDREQLVTTNVALFVLAHLTPKKLWAIPLKEVMGLDWWLVESQSEPGKWYLVQDNGSFCGCKGFGYRRTCTHVQEVEAMKELEGLNNGPDPTGGDDQDGVREGDEGDSPVQGAGGERPPQPVHREGQAPTTLPE